MNKVSLTNEVKKYENFGYIAACVIYTKKYNLKFILSDGTSFYFNKVFDDYSTAKNYAGTFLSTKKKEKIFSMEKLCLNNKN